MSLIGKKKASFVSIEFSFVDNVSFSEGANEAQRKDLLSELQVMKELAPHKHVVELLACITKSGTESP